MNYKITLLSVFSFFMLCMMFSGGVVKASDTKAIDITNEIIDMDITTDDLMNLEDGISTKSEVIDNLKVSTKTIVSTNAASATVYSTTYSCSQTYYDVLESSPFIATVTLTATFKWSNGYVWCTSGTLNYNLSGSTSILITQNTYSSAKKTDLSKYIVAFTLTDSVGSYKHYIELGCRRYGDKYTYFE